MVDFLKVSSLWFVIGLANLALQVWLMFKISTRVDERREIFENDNVAVAIAVAGQVFGLVIVTASAFLRNDTISHMLISSWVGWTMQIVGFVLFDKVVTPKHDLTELLMANKVSVGIAVGSLFVVLGVLAAAGVA